VNGFNRRRFVKKSLTSIVGGTALLSGHKRLFASGTELEFSPYLIVIHCDGGWDPTLVFDSKQSSAYVDIQTGQHLAEGGGKIPYVAHASRPTVDAFFANYGDKSCIINGLYCGSMNHDDALAYSSGTTLPDSTRYTDWVSFYASQVGLDTAFPHVVLDAPYLSGIYGKYTTRLSSDLIDEFSVAGACPVSQSASTGDVAEKALDSYLSTSYQGFMENRLNESIDSEKIQTFAAGYQRESALCNLVAAQTYASTDSTFQKRCKLAVSLLSGGHSYALTIQAGRARQWDTHSNNFTTQSENFEMLFAGINTLLEQAQAQGILDKLTVIVKSEFGRSPTLNSLLKNGKDHWPYTSTLCWGVGINGGKSIGQTDDWMRGLPINPIFGTADDAAAIPLETKHIFAALYNLFGVPSTLILPDDPPASIILSAGA
jgi:hypothetical protein